MRAPVVFAGPLALCAAGALPTPAHADQYDFISQLDNSGVSYSSVVEIITIGKQVCHDLRSGATPPAVLGKLQRTGFAPAESAIVLMSAVSNMCSDTRAEVVAWARGEGYTGPV